MTTAPRAQGSHAALRVAVLEDDELLREVLLLPTLHAHVHSPIGPIRSVGQ